MWLTIVLRNRQYVSLLRNWSVCTHSAFTRRTASEPITAHRPTLLPSRDLFQESSILHILNTQRVCSVSLTTDSAHICSLLQEYHRIFFTGFLANVFSAARALGTFVDLELEQQLGIFTQSHSLYFDFTQSSSALCFFSRRSDDTARFRDSAAQHRLGRVLGFQHRHHDSGSYFIYYS